MKSAVWIKYPHIWKNNISLGASKRHLLNVLNFQKLLSQKLSSLKHTNLN